MNGSMDRRGFFGMAAGAGAMLAAAPSGAEQEKRYQGGASPWALCLNCSTIRPTPFEDKIRIAAETGWDAIEPWINELEEFEKAGGNLKDLGKKIKDLGLFVPNIIGLWDSMPEGEAAFEASLTATRERMRRAAAVGSQFVAAIPSPDRENFDMAWGTHCYERLLQIGRDEFGIIVAFEFVGFLKGIHTLGQASGIALDTDDKDACLISDTFHLFRGNSGFNGIRHLSGDFIANFHWNDVPGDVPREQQGDEHRVYPGDGILPLPDVLKDLKAIGYRRTLSLELFNREHWKQDPKQVAETGLRKMRECIAKAGV